MIYIQERRKPDTDLDIGSWGLPFLQSISEWEEHCLPERFIQHPLRTLPHPVEEWVILSENVSLRLPLGFCSSINSFQFTPNLPL